MTYKKNWQILYPNVTISNRKDCKTSKKLKRLKNTISFFYQIQLLELELHLIDFQQVGWFFFS